MRKLTSFFFLASLFCVTFEKIHWSFAGTVSLADVLAILFLVSFVATTKRGTVPLTRCASATAIARDCSAVGASLA